MIFGAAACPVAAGAVRVGSLEAPQDPSPVQVIVNQGIDRNQVHTDLQPLGANVSRADQDAGQRHRQHLVGNAVDVAQWLNQSRAHLRQRVCGALVVHLVEAVIDPADRVAIGNVSNEQVQAVGNLVEVAVSQAMGWKRAPFAGYAHETTMVLLPRRVLLRAVKSHAHFDGAWRFDSPGPIPSGVVAEFAELISKIVAQGNRKQLLEYFKNYFSSAAGTTHSTSSNESWAQSDLEQLMDQAAANGPLFIEAFYNACEDLRVRRPDMGLPDTARLNRILAEHGSGYQIRPPNLIAATRRDALRGQNQANMIYQHCTLTRVSGA